MAREEDCTRSRTKTARDATLTRTDHAAPGEKTRLNAHYESRTAPKARAQAYFPWPSEVLIGIKYFYVGCLTFLLGFLVSTSLPRLSSCLELQQCFGSEELVT